MQRTIYSHAIRTVLNAVKSSSEYPDFSNPAEGMFLLLDAKKRLQENILGLHTKLQAKNIEQHVEVLLSNLGKVLQLCQPNRILKEDEEIEALNYLMLMSLASAHLLAHRRSAMDRLAESKKLLAARSKGRAQGSQAKRKQLILALYARRRNEWEKPYTAATALKKEALDIAKGIGYPLSEDRAVKTLADWFDEYEAQNPRNV